MLWTTSLDRAVFINLTWYYFVTLSPSLLLRRLLLSHSKEFLFKFNETCFWEKTAFFFFSIDKLEYVSSLFQISNILIFVERECQLSISQMLCMSSAAECESAPLQMSFVTQNWWAASSKCQLDKNRTYSRSPKWDFTGTSYKNIVFSSIYQLYIYLLSFWNNFFLFDGPNRPKSLENERHIQRLVNWKIALS